MLSSLFTQSATPETAKSKDKPDYEATVSSDLVSSFDKETKIQKINKQTKNSSPLSVPGLKVRLRLRNQHFRGSVPDLVRFVQGSTGVDMSRAMALEHSSSVRNFFGSVGLRSVEVELHLNAVALLTSSGAGLINTTLAYSSIIGASAGWSSLTAVFDQFRVMGVFLKAEPYNKYSKTTTLSGPIVLTFDNDDSTALGTYDTNLLNTRHSNTDDLFPDWAWYPRPGSNSVDSLWQDPASPFNLAGGAKAYATSLSASIVYGNVFYKSKVAFRLLAP